MGGKPKHIGIIMDGNRRFAKKALMQPWKGHEYGSETLKKLIEWSVESKVKELTLYTLSTQNLKSRSKAELNFLIDLIKKGLRDLMKDERIEKHKIRFKFIGRLHLFDEELQRLMREVAKKTKNNSGLLVNLGIAYGGNEEIVDAVNKIIENPKKVDEESFKKFLYLKSSPDLIIRTGGRKRTSNFLNYQSVYSEWIFLDILWPDFKKKDFINCLDEFKKRKRSFGV